MALPIEKSEFQDFVEESMQETADENNLGVVFVVFGKKILGIPAPLNIEASPETGMAQREKRTWAIMVPSPPYKTDDFPKGTKITDTKGRLFKVFRAEEKRMCVEIFVIDTNQ